MPEGVVGVLGEDLLHAFLLGDFWGRDEAAFRAFFDQVGAIQRLRKAQQFAFDFLVTLCRRRFPSLIGGYHVHAEMDQLKHPCKFRRRERYFHEPDSLRWPPFRNDGVTGDPCEQHGHLGET